MNSRGEQTYTIDYYATSEKTMGGRDATQEFFRLFLVPGMGHCSGGPGAHAIGYLSYLEDWAERGRAPDVIIGAHVKKKHHTGWDYKLPADPAHVTLTRPVYPYPLRAKYMGCGNPNDAASFAPTR